MREVIKSGARCRDRDLWSGRGAGIENKFREREARRRIPESDPGDKTGQDLTFLTSLTINFYKEQQSATTTTTSSYSVVSGTFVVQRLTVLYDLKWCFVVLRGPLCGFACGIL